MNTDAILNSVEAGGYHIDRRSGPNGNRLSRAQDLVRSGMITLLTREPQLVEAKVNHRHAAAIQFDSRGAVTRVTCSCQDWRTRGLSYSQPCKHILALALEVGNLPASETTMASEAPTQSVAAGSLRFPDRVRHAVAQAITQLASQVEVQLDTGKIPFLLGPTGCGKTSAIRQLAISKGWAFEEIAGSQSFVDADLVGLRTDHMKVPGVLARAFDRAQADETVLVCIDEFTRFNDRVPDLLMRPLQVASLEVARAMGLAATGAIRLAEAPTWGLIWAPAERIKFVLAANPWGSALDPALVRRVEPVEVRFSRPVLELFASPTCDAIEASWQAEAEGQLPLPVEYQALLNATGPEDATIFRAYLSRLRAIDKAAAGGFATLLKGMGISVPEAK